MSSSPALRVFSPAPASDPVHGGPGGLISAALRLSEIYWAHIEPVCQLARDAQPRNLEALRCSLAYWQRFTADPPLFLIDQAHGEKPPPERPDGWQSQAELGLKFVTGLRSLPGKRSPQLSANSIAKHVCAIQAMLDVCGPPDARHRDALGILKRPPWLARPRKTKRPPEDCYALDEIELLLANVHRATAPPGLSIPPDEYMRRLYLMHYNTGMRVQECCLVRWEDDRGEYLQLPARIVAKGHESRPIALNQWARAIVDSMRNVTYRGRTSPRIFGWPWNWRGSRGQLYIQHELIRECLPVQRRKFFAFHACRKLTANELVKINAFGAQKQLGHATAKMTGDHYVSQVAARDSVARLPQPRDRRDRQSKLFD